MKYHADGGPGVRTIYRAIMEHSGRKAADVFKLVKMLVYNYLIGNTDAHAKNFSFLHTDRENGVVLSPAYDLLAVDIYPEKTASHAIAMPINGKGKFAAIRRKDWLQLFAQLGLNPEGTLKTAAHTFDGICDEAQTFATQLQEDPLTASPIYSKIIDNMCRRSEVLSNAQKNNKRRQATRCRLCAMYDVRFEKFGVGAQGIVGSKCDPVLACEFLVGVGEG